MYIYIHIYQYMAYGAQFMVRAAVGERFRPGKRCRSLEFSGLNTKEQPPNV